MRPSIKIALFAGLTMLPVVAVLIYGAVRNSGEGTEVTEGGYTEVFWQKLRGLDYETGRMNEELQNLDGKKVAIPGFVVPLDDEAQGLSEFLLVPSPKACIHVPPPPPNQMVMVKMRSEQAPKREWGPVWIRGTLRIQTSESGFGKVSYVLLGDEAEKYEVSATDT